MSIYDKAYQDNVQAVKTGLISLDDLSGIREYYQAYKKDIHAWIKFINESTSSFEVFTNLDDDSKKSLDEELSKYQSGDLNRSSDLETMLLQQISDSSNDAEDDNKIATLRKNARNKVIDDLADVIKNDNSTTKTKKLKR